MNSFTDLFIRRPVLATVVSLLVLLVGAMAGLKLQIRQFPQMSNTTITITTTYPGANADLIKGFITTPLEQAVASAEGIDTLVSNSQQNVSTITLNLRLDANPDRAVADVLAKTNQVRSVLPRDANDPIVIKQTGQGFALMYISFNSKVMTSSQITDYLTRVVQPRLQTIDGVATGDSRPATRSVTNASIWSPTWMSLKLLIPMPHSMPLVTSRASSLKRLSEPSLPLKTCSPPRVSRMSASRRSTPSSTRAPAMVPTLGMRKMLSTSALPR